MAARLKVFVTSDGLTDYVVAVSSRAKALAAWGVRQDLFKEGRAGETQDAALTKAAMAQPGEVLRRPSGKAGDLAKLKPAKAAAPKGPNQAQRRKVAALEAKLAGLEASHEKARRKLEAQQRELERKRTDLSAAQAEETERLKAKLSAARRAPG